MENRTKKENLRIHVDKAKEMSMGYNEDIITITLINKNVQEVDAKNT